MNGGPPTLDSLGQFYMESRKSRKVFFVSPNSRNFVVSNATYSTNIYDFQFLYVFKNVVQQFPSDAKVAWYVKKNCILFNVKTQRFSIRITQPFQLFHDFPSNWRVFELLQNFFYRFSWKINVGVNCIYFASKRPIKFQVRLQAKPVLPVCCNSSRSDILIHSFPSLRLLRLSAVLLSKECRYIKNLLAN